MEFSLFIYYIFEYERETPVEKPGFRGPNIQSQGTRDASKPIESILILRNYRGFGLCPSSGNAEGYLLIYLLMELSPS
jgi:hypothetical protein